MLQGLDTTLSLDLLRLLLSSLQLEESERIECMHSSPEIRWKERFRTKDCLEPLLIGGKQRARLDLGESGD